MQTNIVYTTNLFYRRLNQTTWKLLAGDFNVLHLKLKKKCGLELEARKRFY